MSKIESDYKILKIMEDEIPTKKRHLDSVEDVVGSDIDNAELFDFTTSDMEESVDLFTNNDLKIVEHNEGNNGNGDLNNNNGKFGSSEEDDDHGIDENEYSDPILINEALNDTLIDFGDCKKERRDSVIENGIVVYEDEAIVNFLDDSTDIVRNFGEVSCLG